MGADPLLFLLCNLGDQPKVCARRRHATHKTYKHIFRRSHIDVASVGRLGLARRFSMEGDVDHQGGTWGHTRKARSPPVMGYNKGPTIGAAV